MLMRIPFSVFLMPIFWLALMSVSNRDLNWLNVVLVFVVWHLFIYPASNGYNSYFDRDEGSIGGLKTPPKVNKELFWLTIIFDSLGLLLALYINWLFGLMVLAYVLVSKAYSWDKIRLKRWPIISLLVVTIFQGGFTLFASQIGFGIEDWNQLPNWCFATTSTLFLMGSYPITQVYQHDEDAKRGDKTLSRLLGVKGTFIFSAILFAIASVCLLFGFYLSREWQLWLVYLWCMLPVSIGMKKWTTKVWQDESHANFENTMKMNKRSSMLLSLAFIIITVFTILSK